MWRTILDYTNLTLRRLRRKDSATLFDSVFFRKSYIRKEFSTQTSLSILRKLGKTFQNFFPYHYTSKVHRTTLTLHVFLSPIFPENRQDSNIPILVSSTPCLLRHTSDLE